MKHTWTLQQSNPPVYRCTRCNQSLTLERNKQLPWDVCPAKQWPDRTWRAGNVDYISFPKKPPKQLLLPFE